MIEHYGVPGMRWGVRKARRSALTSAGSDAERAALKEKYKQTDKTIKGLVNASKAQKSAARKQCKAAKGAYKNDSSRANKDLKSAAKISYKAAKKYARATKDAARTYYKQESG